MNPVRIAFQVNREEYLLPVPPDMTLAELLREQLGLDETPIACETRACGACVVLLDGHPVRACVLPASEIADKTVLTGEGLSGDEVGSILLNRWRGGRAEPSPRCGRCVPGLLLSALAYVQRAPAPPPRDQLRRALRGHPCRCFLHDEVVSAAFEAAREASL